MDVNTIYDSFSGARIHFAGQASLQRLPSDKEFQVRVEELDFFDPSVAAELRKWWATVPDSMKTRDGEKSVSFPAEEEISLKRVPPEDEKAQEDEEALPKGYIWFLLVPLGLLILGAMTLVGFFVFSSLPGSQDVVSPDYDRLSKLQVENFR